MPDDEADNAPPARRRRGRPPASDSAETRRRILSAAQQWFGELGYSGMSVEHLAREVGIDARTVYHYFPSKRALFRSATDAVFEEYAASVADRVLAPGDVRQRLHGFVDAYRELYTTKPHVLPFIAVVMVEGMAVARDERRGQPSDHGAFDPADLGTIGQAALAFNHMVVDHAVAEGHLHASVTPDAAAALLQTVGMGLGLASLDPATPFLTVLDAFDLLIDGALFRH